MSANRWVDTLTEPSLCDVQPRGCFAPDSPAQQFRLMPSKPKVFIIHHLAKGSFQFVECHANCMEVSAKPHNRCLLLTSSHKNALCITTSEPILLQ